VPHTSDLSTWAQTCAGLPDHTSLHYINWFGIQDPENILDHLTFWCPPPEIAYQIIYFVLQYWTKGPLTTRALFLIPHILQKRWSRMSRHVQEIGAYDLSLVTLTRPPLVPIPLVLLYLAPHQRTLPPPASLDPPGTSPDAYLHRKQARLLRELPPANLAEFDKHRVLVPPVGL
jgi:hypothetical protein